MLFRSLAERAHHALAQLDEAFLGTLHAWAFRLLKDYPNESGLGPRVRIANDSELEEVSRLAFHDMLTLASARGESAELARATSAMGGASVLHRSMARALETLTELGVAPLSLQLPDELQALEQIEFLLARAVGSLDAKSAASVFAALGPDAGIEEPSSARPKSGSWPGSKSALENLDLAALRVALGGATLSSAIQMLNAARRHAHKYAESCVFARRWLSDFSQRQSLHLAQSGIASFGEIIAQCRALLRDHPHIADEVAARYDVLLLDEAQDMSRAQADVVSLIWHRAHEERSPGEIPSFAQVRARGLFVVGDRKQSIYGFRGADVRVFVDMCVQIAGDEAREAFGVRGPTAAPATGSFLTIRPNYRSAPAVLDFANAFSASRFALAQAEGDAPGQPDADVRYLPSTDDLLYPDSAAARPVPEPTWLRAADKNALPVAVASAIRTDIVDRAIRPDRIAVLAYRRADLIPIGRSLTDFGVASVQTSRDFYQAPIVGDLLALLRVARDPQDRMAALSVLRGPCTGLLDATLLSLTEIAERGPLIHGDYPARLASAGVSQDECMRYARTSEALKIAAERVSDASPYALLRALIESLDLDGVLAQMPDGPEQLANMRKLLRASLADKSVVRFVDRVLVERDRATPEEEASLSGSVGTAVQLMTVHASKGLDFDAVYFVYSTRRSRADAGGWMVSKLSAGGAVLFPKWAGDKSYAYAPLSMVQAQRASALQRDQEDARKAYVATTRARDQLTLVGVLPPERTSKKALPPSDESALLALAEAGLVRVQEAADTEVSTVVSLHREVLTLPRASSSLPVWKHMQIAPTALGDFARCERLFSLRHVLGAAPLRVSSELHAPRLHPAPSLPPTQDAAQQGVVLHRVLEHLPAEEFGAPHRDTVEALLAREGISEGDPSQAGMVQHLLAFVGGAFAADCRARDATLHRELPFVLTLEDRGRVLELRGTADLVIEHQDGSIDIVDYKRGAGPHAALHAFQLGVYACAMKQRFPNADRIRAGVAFLGEGHGEVRFLDAEVLTMDAEQLMSHADGLAHARARGRFAPREKAQCTALHCPYLGTCWTGQGGG